MGTQNVDGDSFFYDFAERDQRVRFAVTIPYVQKDLEAFLKENASPHLKTTVLTKSQKGREVKLLQIGSPGPNVQAVLVTGRHHAAETIASFVLEGFLKEAMSESEVAQEFRQKYVLYAVPFVDKDGVEEGDQGRIADRMTTTGITVRKASTRKFGRSKNSIRKRTFAWLWISTAPRS